MARKAFDGAKLSNDIAKLQAADKMSPPAARPSLMDAVRALAKFIGVRAKLGWTDAMIATVLTDAGYAIDAPTLRSYRKRLRDEGLLQPLAPRAPQTVFGQPATATATIAAQIPDAVKAPVANGELGGEEHVPIVAVEPTSARAPPGTRPTPRRSFAVDPAKLPPDEA